MMANNLPLDGVANLVEKMAESYFEGSVENKACENKQTYKVTSSDESYSVARAARTAAFKELDKSNAIVKQAFDTRRVNQETERNPRSNLQYWHRSDEFIDSDDQKKIAIFAKLLESLNSLREKFGKEHEWHDSYARQLYDSVHRILRTKQADGDFFRPQFVYLEQLLDSRYLLTLDNIEKLSASQLEATIIERDEPLQKRGFYLAEHPEKTAAITKIDTVTATKENIINAIFGLGTELREGNSGKGKVIERTITITIRDNVLDD